MPRQRESASQRYRQIVDERHAIRTLRADRQSRLPEIEVDAKRLEGLAHVVLKIGFKFQRGDVAEVVAREGVRQVAVEVGQIHHTGVPALRAPKLRQTPK